MKQVGKMIPLEPANPLDTERLCELNRGPEIVSYFMRHLRVSFACVSIAALGGTTWVLSADANAGAKAQLLHADYASSFGSVDFRATGHPSALHVDGKGAGPQGTLSITQTGVAGTVGFDLQSLDTGIVMRNEHMKEKYLEVGKYPQAELTITEVKLPQPLNTHSMSLSGAPFHGVLKLHGVEKPVSGTVDLKTTGPGVLETDASFVLKLTDFGIEIPKYFGITIADEVQVTVNTSAHLH